METDIETPRPFHFERTLRRPGRKPTGTPQGLATRKRVLDFIVDYKRAHGGMAPVLREIMEACKITSTSTVYYHLWMLQREGKIVCGLMSARAIQIPGEVWMLHDEFEERLKAEHEPKRVLRKSSKLPV